MLLGRNLLCFRLTLIHFWCLPGAEFLPSFSVCVETSLLRSTQRLVLHRVRSLPHGQIFTTSSADFPAFTISIRQICRISCAFQAISPIPNNISIKQIPTHFSVLSIFFSLEFLSDLSSNFVITSENSDLYTLKDYHAGQFLCSFCYLRCSISSLNH